MPNDDGIHLLFKLQRVVYSSFCAVKEFIFYCHFHVQLLKFKHHDHHVKFGRNAGAVR